jgi:archaellum component FlaD/FlaE
MAIAAAVTAAAVVGTGMQVSQSKAARERSEAETKRSKEEQDRLVAEAKKKEDEDEALEKVTTQNAATRSRQKILAAASAGRAGTIQTSPLGIVSPPTTAGKSVLGA